MGVSRRVHISLSIVFGLYSVWMSEEDKELLLIQKVVFLVAGIYHIILFLAAFIRILMSGAA